MMVNEIKEKITLKLELDGGIVDGKEKKISKNFSKIRKTASDGEIYATGIALAGLQERALKGVKRIEEVTLLAGV